MCVLLVTLQPDRDTMLGALIVAVIYQNVWIRYPSDVILNTSCSITSKKNLLKLVTFSKAARIPNKWLPWFWVCRLALHWEVMFHLLVCIHEKQSILMRAAMKTQVLLNTFYMFVFTQSWACLVLKQTWCTFRAFLKYALEPDTVQIRGHYRFPGNIWKIVSRAGFTQWVRSDV